MATTAPAMLSPERARRNYLLGVLDGTLFRLSYVLADPSLVLPWFIAQLTASPVAVGLLLPLNRMSATLPQFLLTGVFHRANRKMPLYRVAAAGRVLSWALAVLAVWVLGARHRPLL